MQMSVGEIQRSYNTAKNKKAQIGILAELNDCSVEEIEKIIGVESGRRKEPAEVPVVPTELTRGEIMDMLFGRMDVLDKEIKRLEEEYRNLSITIEVPGKIGGR